MKKIIALLFIASVTHGATFLFNDGTTNVYQGTTVLSTNRQSAVTLPTNLTANTMYIAWGTNATYEVGEPFTINQTEAWWVGPDTVATGDMFRVFGQNLELGDDGKTQLYVMGATTNFWLTNNVANPYMAQFTMPAIPTGTYNIYAHNGHGRKYGWSDALTITVWDGPGWAGGATYDVTAYGLDNTGATNNSTALDALWGTASAGDWSTLYFPAGEYKFDNTSTLTLGDWGGTGIRLLGDGTNSIISIEAESTGTDFVLRFSGKDNLYFEDMAFALKDITYTGSTTGFEVRSCDNVTFDSVLFDNRDLVTTFSSRGLLTMFLGNNTLFTNCLFYLSKQSDLNCQDVIFDSCTFRGVHDCGNFTGASVEQLAIIDSTFDHLDNSVLTNRAGWWKGRMIVGVANAAAANWYIGGNTATNAAPRWYSGAVSSPPVGGGDYVDWNSGEMIMKEGGISYERRAVTSATSNSVSFANGLTQIDDWYGVIVTVVAGKGAGQAREADSSVSGATTITLDENWRIQPDNTSVITVGRSAYRWAVYGNYLHADNTRFVDGGIINASAGIQFSSGGAGHSVSIANNTFDGTRSGVNVDVGAYPNYNSSYSTVSPFYFNVISDNTFNSNNWVVSDMSHNLSSGLLEWEGDIQLLGTVFRNNTSSNTIISGDGGEALYSGVPIRIDYTPEDNTETYLWIFQENAFNTFVNGAIYSNAPIYNSLWLNNTTNGASWSP